MISGKILRDAIISGANNINNQRSRVDELNVFPVPDGDTGTNMGMTVGAAVRELQAMDDSCTVGEAAKTAASAMLRGARGNSGVITSLLFRGFSKALEGKKEADAADIVAALKKGVEGAYKAVMKPTEGTILTVARDSEYDGKRIKKGEIMALENGKIVSTSSDITKATYRLARGMCKKDSSFVTIISGCDVSDEDAEKVTEIVKAKCPNHVEVSHIRGGQPVYYYMISVE